MLNYTNKVSLSQYVLSVISLLGLTSCMESTEVDGYKLVVSSSNQAYIGAKFTNDPTITFQSLTTGEPYTGLKDEVTITAFLDSACTIPSKGTIIADATTVPLTDGIAQFKNFAFRHSPSWREAPVYFKITTKKQKLSPCLTSTEIMQPSFGSGPNSSQTTYQVGFVSGGRPGDAGADTTNQTDSITRIKIDSMGRYVTSGRSRPSGTTSAISVRRILPNGAKDTDFGTGYSAGTAGRGYTIPSITLGASGVAAGAMNDMSWASAVDSSGRILMTGTSGNTGTNAAAVEFAMWRVLDSGALDTSFTNGTSAYAGSIRGGTTSAAGGTGALDIESARALVIDSQGRYLAGGYSVSNTGYGYPTLWRINTDGTFDSTFTGSLAGAYPGSSKVSTSGAAGGTTVNGFYSDVIYDMVVDSQGRIIAVGSSYNSDGRGEMAMWRFNADGTRDTSFVDADDPRLSGAVHFNGNQTGAGTAGGNATYVSGACAAAVAGSNRTCDSASGVIIDSSGRYVVIGQSRNASGGTEMAVWRYNSNGTRDTTFPAAGTGATSNRLGSIHLGTSNVMGVSSASLVFNRGMSISLDSSGRYVITGNSRDWNCTGGAGNSYRVMIARINTDGSLDSTFGQSGTGAISNLAGTVTAYGYDGVSGSSANFSAAGQTCASGLMYDVAWASAIDSYGRIVAGGWSANTFATGAFGWEWVMWRFRSNGAEDK